jgi:hypothetical protein
MMMSHENDDHRPFWRSPIAIGAIAALAIAAAYVTTEHWQHLGSSLPYLPYLLLLACPLMHLFMHGGHGGQAEHGVQKQELPGPESNPRPR